MDPNGVAKRVAKGKGTHYVYISQDNETHLEQKVNIYRYTKVLPILLLIVSNPLQSEMIASPAAIYQSRNKWSSLKIPPPYEKRVHPMEEKPLQ